MEQKAYIEYLVKEYADTILRLSYTYLKNKADAQDVCQTVFMKILQKNRRFENPSHEKSFLLRMTANVCKDILKSAYHTRTCSLENCKEQNGTLMEESSILWAVAELPEKYRTVIHLHYYEGYKAYEIGKILKIPTPTVHTRLARGRKKLKTILGGEIYEGNTETVSKRNG